MTVGRRIVVGVGNRDRGDDGVGPAVADLVAVEGRDIATWIVEGDPSTLAARWRPDDRVVVVDAVVTGSPPGTLVELSVEEAAAAPGGGSASTHGFGVGEAIALSRAVGTMPRHGWVLGVEAGELHRGAGLSPPVQAAVAAAARRAPELLGITTTAATTLRSGQRFPAEAQLS
jgi:hydrogenase maturation protease